MVRILLILICGVLISCQVSKKAGEQQKNPQAETENPQTNKPDSTYYSGEVQILDCGAVIRIFQGKTNFIYTPTNLEPEFQADKLQLKLKFKVLDERGTTCSEFKAIEIKEVFIVR
jgi:hypothetical protein